MMIDLETATAIGVLIGPILTVLLSKGMEALVKWKNAQVDEQLKLQKAQEERDENDHKKMTSNYEFVIGELNGQLKTIRADMESMRKEHRENVESMRKEHRAERDSARSEHLECVKVQGELRGRIEELEKSWRRHDEKNTRHIEGLVKDVEKIQAQAESVVHSPIIKQT